MLGEPTDRYYDLLAQLVDPRYDPRWEFDTEYTNSDLDMWAHSLVEAAKCDKADARMHLGEHMFYHKAIDAITRTGLRFKIHHTDHQRILALKMLKKESYSKGFIKTKIFDLFDVDRARIYWLLRDSTQGLKNTYQMAVQAQTSCDPGPLRPVIEECQRTNNWEPMEEYCKNLVCKALMEVGLENRSLFDVSFAPSWFTRNAVSLSNTCGIVVGGRELDQSTTPARFGQGQGNETKDS